MTLDFNELLNNATKLTSVQPPQQGADMWGNPLTQNVQNKPSTNIFSSQQVPQQPVEETNTGNVFGGQPAQTPTGNVFGGQPAQTPTGNVFGEQPAQAPTSNVFGGEPAQAPIGNVFGEQLAQTPTGNVFGEQSAQAPTGNVFGEQPAQTPTGNVFGEQPAQAPTGNVFGEQSAQAPTGNVFGEQPAQAPTGNVFGGETAQAQTEVQPVTPPADEDPFPAYSELIDNVEMQVSEPNVKVNGQEAKPTDIDEGYNDAFKEAVQSTGALDLSADYKVDIKPDNTQVDVKTTPPTEVVTITPTHPTTSQETTVVSDQSLKQTLLTLAKDKDFAKQFMKAISDTLLT